MTDRYILDADGKPQPEPDLTAWADWFEKDERRLAQDEFGDVRVSTVFLALNHSFGTGPKQLWETMIFGGEHDLAQWRYATREEALEGHAFAVSLVTEQ